MPKVSIILTTHGDGKYLKQAIGSVLAQTFEDWECIVACDRVDKKVSELLSIFHDADKRIDWFHFRKPLPLPSCIFAASINDALHKTHGEYLTYLCHDDLYLPWRLAAMVVYLELGWDVCFGHQRLIHQESDQILNHGLHPRIGNPDQPAGTVDHSSVMHRRECFEKAGGWDENAPPRYGDAYFWMRLQNAGYKFHCIPEVLDCHRFNRESITWKEDHPDESKLPILPVRS